MAIKIYNNKIMIGNFTLQESVGGFVFDGQVRAESYVQQHPFQGEVAGYASGGTGNPPVFNTIDYFPFAADANATDFGDLTVARASFCGMSSATEGYTSGGYFPPSSISNVIDKFPFATKTNATSVATVLTSKYEAAGHSSPIAGYVSGGFNPPSFAVNNSIEKIFFSNNNYLAQDVGDITQSRGGVTGCSSAVSGYTCGGETVLHTTNVNTIDKFPFAGDSNSTDVGDLTAVRGRGAGQSSTTHGYVSGGGLYPSPGTYTNNINKFSFASDGNATSIATLTSARAAVGGQSSTVSGYSSGGAVAGSGSTTVDKFPFATDSNATSVGALTQARFDIAGHQY
jgi:hypothetical protein